MAVTRLSDVIVPSVFFPYLLKRTMEKSAIFQAGILRSDAELAAKLSGGGRTFDVPFWKDLDNTESGVASDDPAVSATPGNITASKDIARRQIRTRGWSAAKLAGELAGDDPMKRIAERVADYWTRQFQRILVNTLTGIFADNAANDAGDMRLDVGTDAVGAPASAELVSSDAILSAKQTMGDAADGLTAIVMHSVVHTRLQSLNLIDFIPDAEGRVRFGTYLGYRVIVDDGVRVVQGTNRKKYSTYLAGAEALGWAEVATDAPVEVEHKPAAGNGMGVDELWTRRQFALHPYGIKFTDASVAGQFPTNAELATAANWDRVYAERKQIPLVELVTNG